MEAERALRSEESCNLNLAETDLMIVLRVLLERVLLCVDCLGGC